MPYLTQIRVNSFRNLDEIDLNPCPGFNLIYGVNGSGKSSLLESIHTLSTARSFRTNKFRTLIQEGQKSLTAFGLIIPDANNGETPIRVGLERASNGKSTVKVDGVLSKSSSELARNLPLLVINSDTFLLLDGASKVRRQFFDWLVFHVKHDFFRYLKDYLLCIKQRNSLLRRDRMSYAELRPWDMQLTDLSEKIVSIRQECFDEFYSCFYQSLFSKEASEGSATFSFVDKERLNLEYKHGYDVSLKLADVLEKNFDKDIRYGYTTEGPHKADLVCKVGSHHTKDILSRGQQKLFSIELILAKAKLFVEKTKTKPVFLIDDLPAELDIDNRKYLLNALNDMGSQVFVSSIERNDVDLCLADISNKKMFHVKHGTVRELES